MLLSLSRPVAAMVIWGVGTFGIAAAQPFDLPSPNVPDDVRGISPALRITFGTHEWGDFNSDGEMDFVMMGRLPVTPLGTVPLFADVLRCSPSRPEPVNPTVYDYFSARTFKAMWLSDAAWGDFDNDGDLDLVAQGATSVDGDLAPQTILYMTSGNQIGVLDDSSLPGLYAGALDWGDYDNDGDLDLAVSGTLADGRHATTIYRNDRQGRFEDVTPGLVQLAFGTVDWVDLDLDGDLDLFVTGAEKEGRSHAILYRNDGEGLFVDSGQDLPGVSHSSTSWGDYDADGDPDLLMTGFELSPTLGSGISRLFRNDLERLVEVPADLPVVYFGDVGWVDYDSDGDLDALISGQHEPFGSRATSACVQDAEGIFTCDQIQLIGLGAQPVPGVAYGTLSWSDYDHDSDLDLFVSGDVGGSQMTTFYRNAGSGRNTPPQPPEGLSAFVSSTEVILTWTSAVDPDGSSTGLMYSVRVGSTPGGVDVVSPHADPFSGQRHVLDEGNAGHRQSLRLVDLPAGTYSWSVQAIDNSFAGSPFAADRTFTVGG